MSNIDKQTLEDDESVKTYYIHPAAFGSTKNPGYGHVPVVHADDFEKLRAKLEAAEKRIAELGAREVKLPDINNYLSDVTEPTLDRALRLTAKGVRSGDMAAIRAAGIRIQGEG